MHCQPDEMLVIAKEFATRSTVQLTTMFSTPSSIPLYPIELMPISFYANVSTAINGDINGKNAVPTRPIAATAMAPNSNNSNISFHLLFFCASSNMRVVLSRCYYTCAAPHIMHDERSLLGVSTGQCMFTVSEHCINLYINHKKLCHRKIFNKTYDNN
jgi:hypothetical protein